MRQVSVPIFGRDGVPWERREEIIVSMAPSQGDALRLAWREIDAGLLCFDAILIRAPTREFLARAVRMQERGAPPVKRRIRPIISLRETEGY